jgi:hypothetical protein
MPDALVHLDVVRRAGARCRRLGLVEHQADVAAQDPAWEHRLGQLGQLGVEPAGRLYH